jgi:hypothetical protein
MGQSAAIIAAQALKSGLREARIPQLTYRTIAPSMNKGRRTKGIGR